MRIDWTRSRRLAPVLLMAAVLPGLALAGPIDSDFDGVVDGDDNCPHAFNPLQENDDNDDWGDACDNCLGRDNNLGGAAIDQCDTDTDGYGNACDGDFNNDSAVGLPDFNLFRTAFQTGAGAPSFAEADSNCDGAVGLPDFNDFRSQFLQGTPGASGRDCAGDGSGSCLPAPQL